MGFKYLKLKKFNMSVHKNKKVFNQKVYWSKRGPTRRKPDHPVVSATFDPLASVVIKASKNSNRSNILDVGCGNGYLQFALEKYFKNVIGLDYSQSMLTNNPCNHKLRGLCTQLPFPDKSFDMVVASHLLHHMNEADRIRTLCEMHRVARDCVISFEPNCKNPFNFIFSLIKKEERMALKFTRMYMHNLFIKANIKSMKSHIDGWITPNIAPIWWVPFGQKLRKTFLKKIGFDIYCIAKVNRKELNE